MRLFGVPMAVAMVAGMAWADLPIPPLEKDEKEVSVTSEVLLGKDVTGYVFVQKVGQGPGAPQYSYEKVELSQKTPKAMANNGRYTYVSLVAVPEDAAKEFKTDKDLFAALEARRVKGVHEVSLGGGTVRVKKAAVKENALTETYTITAIDAKEGIKTSKNGGLPDEPKKDEKKPLALSEPGTFVGGFAAALSITLGGLWLVRRRKADR